MTIRHVDGDLATGNDDGTTWADAFQSLNTALLAATHAPGDQYLVAGTFTETVNIAEISTVGIPTLVQGDDKSGGDGVRGNPADFTIDGESTRANGLTSSLGGVNLYYVFENMIVTGCTGSGVSLIAENQGTFKRCRFHLNSIGTNVDDAWGFQECQADNNTSHGFTADATSFFMNCVSFANGGNAFSTQGTFFYGCLAYGLGSADIGFNLESSSVYDLVNCTVDGENVGVGIDLIAGGGTLRSLVNCLIYDCTTGVDANRPVGEFSISLNNLVNSNTTDYVGAATFTGEVTGAPSFTDEAGDDYSLGSASPAKAAGIDAGKLNTGTSYVDIGAVQRQEPVSQGLVDVAPFQWPGAMEVYGSTNGLSTTGLDAVNEAYAPVFFVPETGVINRVGFELTAVTNVDPATEFTVQIRAVDLSTGLPSEDLFDGYFGEWVQTGAGNVSNGWNWFDFRYPYGSGAATVTKGDLIAVMISITNIGGSDVANVRSADTNTGGRNSFPFVSYRNTSSVWSRLTLNINIGLEYDPGVYKTAPELHGISQITTNTTQEEKGIRFRCPFKGRISGIKNKLFRTLTSVNTGWDFHLMADGTAPGGTRLASTSTLDADLSTSPTSYRISGYIRFTTPYEIEANVWYKLVAVPLGGDGHSVKIPVDSNALLQQVLGTTELSYVEEDGSGGWTNDTSAFTPLFPVFDQVDDGLPDGGGSASDYLENQISDYVFNAGYDFQSATVYLALYTSNPNEDNTGTEVSGNGYTRKLISFSEPVNGVTSNDAIITFPTATGSWGTVTHFAVFDAETVGNMLVYSSVGTASAVADGEIFQVASGSLTITVV